MYSKRIDNGENELVDYSHNYKTKCIFQSTDIEEYYAKASESLTQQVINCEHLKGSGFSLQSITNLVLQINKYDPLKGSSYIELPKWLANKKAIINVKNTDNECFKWAILSCLYPMNKNSERVTKYKTLIDELVFTGIDFPVKLNDIPKFEKLNNISVNVYCYVGKNKIGCLHLTEKELEKHVNLVYITEELNPDMKLKLDSNIKLENLINGHYCWIKDFSRFIRSQVTKHKSGVFWCYSCLQHFYKSDDLNQHRINCSKNKPTMAVLPKEGKNNLKFKNYKNLQRVPFVIYADFETLPEKIDNYSPHNPKEEKSSTNPYQKHKPISFSYYIKSGHHTC